MSPTAVRQPFDMAQADVVSSSSPQSTGIPAHVLVIIPCLNEERYIESIVKKILAEQRRINLKLVVADGGSTDGTKAIVSRIMATSDRVSMMENPERIQAAAINRAVRSYGEDARFLIRVDAHAHYPARFCETLLKTRARTNADSVVVSMRAEGSACFQRAAAAAQNSILGNGGSSHRNESAGEWVEHGHHALMTVEAFNAVGGYDETFPHNEDAELDARLIKRGFHIFLTGDTYVTYFPRASIAGLFRQYFNFGHGRARNFVKHRKGTKSRHLVLTAIAPAICLAALAPIAPILAVPAALWALLCLGYGLFLGVRSHDLCAASSGVAAIAMQAGWSFGFFAGLWRAFTGLEFPGRKRLPR
jgi:succinoglycan biosynthesis protein ExoA